MTQLSLFDALHRPPIILPVDGAGPVIAGDAHETLLLPHPRMAWERARIELHPHDGLWMWSVSYNCSGFGGGYKVGVKWGRFAETRDDALFYAVAEIEAGLARHTGRDAAEILSWARGLT